MKIKIFIAIIVFLSVTASFYAFRYKLSEKEKTALKNENTALIDNNKLLTAEALAWKQEVERYNESQTKAAKTIQELRQNANRKNEKCDCYNMPIDGDIIDVLRHR